MNTAVSDLIDVTKKEFQPLVTGITEESYADAHEMVTEILQANGFSEWPNGYSYGFAENTLVNVAERVIAQRCGTPATKGKAPFTTFFPTLGVELFRLGDFAWHQLSGTYDALPLVEKWKMSGCTSLLSGDMEKWLLAFDRCGKPRPGDGCK